MKVQLTIALLAVAVCGQYVEAKGRRMVQQQPTYTQYYTPTQYSTPAAATSVPAQPSVASSVTTPAAPASPIVQTSNAATTNTVVQADSTAAAAPGAAPSAPVAAAYGSAQWKAEQSARMCSVAHLGGGFGGGSYEGNGFGATAQQAIQNSCFWGTRQPIQIGVARGANGYYATVFYR